RGGPEPAERHAIQKLPTAPLPPRGPPQQGGRRRQPARPSRAEERPKRSPRGWPTVHYRGALRMAPRGPGQGAQGERADRGSGGEGRRRGARAGRRNAIATLRTVAAAAAPPRLGGGADTQGALPLGDPRGGGTDIILRDLGHMWASGRLVVLNRRIPVACSAGRLPRQANVRGRRGGRARAAGRGRRGGGGPSPERRSKNSRSTRMRRRR
ncbi:unnamed protein product, partial [Prorocentrum cordatum]